MRHSAPNRKLCLTTLLLLLILLLAHCGRNRVPPIETAQPVELSWLTFDGTSKIELALVESYQIQHPNITFNRQQVNGNQAYLTHSPAPDLAMAFADYDYLLATHDNLLADLSEVWVEAPLDDAVLPNVQTLVMSSDNGKPYMVPIAFTWAAIYYNRALFEQYNLQPPQSWDEFMEICATLHANGITPLAMAGTEGFAYSLWFDYLNLRLNGAEYHRALLAGQERFDDPRISIVLEFWRSLFEQGYVVARPEVMNANDAINALSRANHGPGTGEAAAMVLVDTITISAVQPDFRSEIGFFPVPRIDPTIPMAESIDVIGYVVPSKANHISQAQDFLVHLASPASTELIAREAATINAVYAPVRVDIDPTALTDDMQLAIAMLQDTTAVVPFTFQSMHPALWKEFNRAYRLLLRDRQDIHSFMESMELARQNAIAAGDIE